MSFGLKVRSNSNGAELNTALDAQGFTLIGMYSLASGASGTIPLPDYAGLTVHIDELPVGSSSGSSGFTCHTTSVDYSSGYPVVSYAPNPTAAHRHPASQLILFAT